MKEKDLQDFVELQMLAHEKAMQLVPMLCNNPMVGGGLTDSNKYMSIINGYANAIAMLIMNSGSDTAKKATLEKVLKIIEYHVLNDCLEEKYPFMHEPGNA